MRNRNGFTLIELLVVITIIVVLAGLLIPGVLRAMKQAKNNRALSEMQHLATVITQVYSEVGYYVRLEDLVKSDTSDVWLWESFGHPETPPPSGTRAASDYINGLSDDEIGNITTNPYYGTKLANTNITTGNMWNGPYTTYKNYVVLPGYGSRPIDPWGKPTGSDFEKKFRQYRMFWVVNSNYPLNDSKGLVPAGAGGAMVIISAGGDGKYQCGITAGKTPVDAARADFSTFNPAIDKGDDIYYIFNAGIQ